VTDNNRPDFSVDRVIHEQARLAILTYLASSESRELLFTELKDALEMTAGNLSVQLRNLETAGYVQIDKDLTGRRPVTAVSLTIEGMNALRTYITKMEDIIKNLKSAEEKKNKSKAKSR